MKSAGEQLTEWLEIRGRHGRSKLARRLEISVPSIINWERSRAIPALRHAIKLRDLCGIGVESWLDPENDPAPAMDSQPLTRTAQEDPK